MTRSGGATRRTRNSSGSDGNSSRPPKVMRHRYLTSRGAARGAIPMFVLTVSVIGTGAARGAIPMFVLTVSVIGTGAARGAIPMFVLTVSVIGTGAARGAIPMFVLTVSVIGTGAARGGIPMFVLTVSVIGTGAARGGIPMFVLTVSVFWVQGPSEAIYPWAERSHLPMFVLTVSVFWVQGPSEAIYPCLFSLFLYSGYRGRAEAIYPCLFSLFLYSGYRGRAKPSTHVCSHCFCILGTGAERSHLPMFVLTVSVFWVQGPSEAIYPCLFSLFLYSGYRGRAEAIYPCLFSLFLYSGYRGRAKPSTHVCSHCFCILGTGAERSHLPMFVLTVSVFWVQGPSEAIYPCLFSLFLYSGYRGRAKPSTHVCSHCFCILGAGAERSHLPMFVLTVSVFWVQGPSDAIYPCLFSLFLYSGYRGRAKPSTHVCSHCFCILGTGAERNHLPMFVLTVSVFWVQGPSEATTHVCSHCFCILGTGAERSHLPMFVLTVSVFWVQGPSEAIYPCLFSLFLYSGCRGRAKPSTHINLFSLFLYSGCRGRAKRSAKLGGDHGGRSNLISDEELRNRTRLLQPLLVEHSKAVTVTGVDFNKKRNGSDHHTSEYDIKDLVVRRGQPFTITIKTDRAVDAKCDVVVLQFSFGTRPQGNKGTLLRLNVDLSSPDPTSSSPVAGGWTAQAGKCDSSTLEVKVTSSATAMVGRYSMFVESALQGQADTKRRLEIENEDLYIIFNPWCEADVVYMSDPAERCEYVENDKGRIWIGSAYNNFGKPWNFGQFESPVLEAALHLMDLGEIMDSARRSPVAFIRAVSALANSCDDDGVLEGRWTEKYPKDCTVPWLWTGSVKIIENFMETGKPVRFGQCWVFSGIVTSLLRSVGIPTRSVTNFQSAHDTDCSMTIDNHYDEDDEPLTERDDSVWNFHVWNESYFRRLDLPKGYDGWQAHDATPQETSEGVMRCGPAPVKAIKEGHVYLNYDTAFIFSEVNGDKVAWRVSEDGDMEIIDIDAYAVGKNISTKAVGSNLRHDLTGDYKYPDGSPEERKVVAFVKQCGTRAEFITPEHVRDVEFKIIIQEGAVLGKDFQIVARLKNKAKEVRHIRGRMTVLSSFYTGVPGKRIKGSRFDVDVLPNGESDLTLDITTDEYLDKLNPEASLQAYVSLSVDHTKQHYARSQAFTLSKPFLTITVPEGIQARVETKGVVKFTNPLSISLTGASFNLEGASVMSADTYQIPHPIKPGQEVTHDFVICPRRSGVREVAATFTSDQLSGVDGSAEFQVQP
ncbi:hypothetical protein RRG08_019350 [Elysia crispata]|uniref:Transglutaminase-like domain-containing protein n=1 Tax=Elysia crispata TaxID=231223 RepID=A0AAE1B4N3_9GAST|nr:hypothetical protein RRG08_019350 [Elysia crispata]